MVYVTFSHPEYLWYVLVIPLLIMSHFVLLKYVRRKAIKFANFKTLKRVSDEHYLNKNYVVLILRSLILILLILAVSGSTLWYLGESNDNDFILTIDTSSSMSAQDFSPNRIGAAKSFSSELIKNLDSESKIGIVTFSGVPYIELLPNSDKTIVNNAINDISIADVGGTDIPGAIITSTNLLLPSTNGRSIILITDGSNTAGYYTKDPISQSITYAKQNNVIVYAIGIGTDSAPIGYLPEYYNISSVYDENTLKKIANETNGEYYYASNTADLKNVYTQIISKKHEAYLHIDLAQGFLLIALLLIFIEWGLINTRFRTVP